MTANGVLRVDRWQHIALVADGGEITLYVDGVAHNTVTSRFDFNGPNMLVGAPFLQTYGNPFAGNIDDLSLWNTALTTTEIASLAADQPRPNEDVTRFEDIDVSQHLPLLVPGTNVLAIQGLNASATDDDFLILPRLIDRGDAFLPGLVRYFSEPTPAAQNGVVSADVGPIISQVSEPAGALAATDPLAVTAMVTPTFEDPGEVLLYYRVMFGQELSAPMFDDGAHGDGLSGDSIFGATIPAGVASAGRMLRYRVTASDSQGNTTRWPPFADPLGTPEYLGTIVEVSIATSLPVLHWFTENASAAQSAGGSRASLFLDGEFYDNRVTREMYLRRLRTPMDELLQPPGTPLAQRKLETRLDELSTLLQSDDASLASSARSLKNFVAARCNHLYVTHSVDNLANYPGAAGIPHAQVGNPTIDFGVLEHDPVSGNQDEEYLTLVNPGVDGVDISGWQLTGGVRTTFRPGTASFTPGVLGRHVFYNRSFFDGNDPTAHADDHAAIATDKLPLLPGGSPS